MNRDERPSVKNLPARPYARALALLVLLLLAPAAARAQWTTPDASGNVSSTNTGNVGIGTASPAAKLDVSDDLRVGAGRLRFTFSGPEGQVQGATERLSFSTPNVNNAQTTRMRLGGNAANSTVEFLNVSSVFLSSTSAKFGVGTSNPTSKFHLVSGTDSATSMLSLDTGVHGGTAFAIGGTANNESTLDMSVYRAGQYVSRFGVNNSGNVYLQPGGGNVGIGTTNPDTYGDGGTVNYFALQAAGTNQHAQLAVAGTGTGNGQIVFGNSTIRRAVIAAVDGSHLLFYVNNANSGTSALEAMRITGGGNVGVGTSSPQDRLHVKGSLRVQGTNVNGDIAVMSADGATGKWDFFASGANGSMGFYDIVSGTLPLTVEKAAPSNTLYVTAAGRVGVGNAAPSFKLDVAGQVRSSSGGFVFPDGTVQATAASSSVPSGWTDDGTSVRLTNGTAKVGVGTSGPSAGLDVQTPVAAGVNAPTHGVRLQQTLTNGNNNGTINGLFINPTFDDGVAVGVTHNALATGAGNVGIGTTATGAGLDVQNAGVVSGGATYGVRFQQTIPSANNNTASTAVLINPTFSDGMAVGVKHYGLVVTSGNVGIGTTAPGAKLSLTTSAANDGLLLYGSANWALLGANLGDGSYNNISRAGDRGVVYGGASAGSPGGGFVIAPWASATSGLRVDAAGNVGIGVAAPAHTLEVAGTINASGGITGATINATYQDVAEWVPSSQKLSAGTVVVLDKSENNHVLASTRAYDTKVAGVVSAEPGVILGVGGEGKLKVATTGRVRVKADATRSPIEVGDLLVTGEAEGVAMKSVEVDLGGVKIHRPGTIIGKALEPLASGTGEILVLLSLQ